MVRGWARHLSLGAPLPCSSARKMPHARGRAPPVNGDTLDTPCALSGRQGRDQTREERSKFGSRPTRCTPLRQRKLRQPTRCFAELRQFQSQPRDFIHNCGYLQSCTERLRGRDRLRAWPCAEVRVVSVGWPFACFGWPLYLVFVGWMGCAGRVDCVGRVRPCSSVPARPARP